MDNDFTIEWPKVIEYTLFNHPEVLTFKEERPQPITKVKAALYVSADGQEVMVTYDHGEFEIVFGN